MIVLDTHVLIWMVQGDARLGDGARETIERQAIENAVLVPAICAWEIALVVMRGQVVLPLQPGAWMRLVLDAPGFRLAPLEPEIAIDSVALDWPHKDPADRMIVATARHWRAPLLTVDRRILEFAAAGQVEVIDARR